MAFNDFFGKGKDPKDLDISRILIETTKSFISNNKKKIIGHDERGNKVYAFSDELLSKLINLLTNNVESNVQSFVEQIDSTQKLEQSVQSVLRPSIIQIEETINRNYAALFEGITFSSPHDRKYYYILPKISKGQETMSQSLTAILNNLENLVKGQQDVIKQNSKVIEEQHNRILRYENDVLFKSKKELLMELIGIADQIKLTLDEQHSNKDYESLIEAIKTLGEWVNGSLQTETVRKYEYSKNVTPGLNAKYQEVTGSEPTNDPNEDGQYKTLLPGYFWTMPLVGSAAAQVTDNAPRSFEFVLRPEQVVRLVYSAKETETNDNSIQTESKPISSLDQSKEPESENPKVSDDSKIGKHSIETITPSHIDREDIGRINFASNDEEEMNDHYNRKKR